MISQVMISKMIRKLIMLMNMVMIMVITPKIMIIHLCNDHDDHRDHPVVDHAGNDYAENDYNDHTRHD